LRLKLNGASRRRPHNAQPFPRACRSLFCPTEAPGLYDTHGEEFDRLYERMGEIPDGPEREALFLQAKNIGMAYMPYKFLVHRISSDLTQPWLKGFRRTQFWQDWWHRVDVEPQHARGR